MHVLSACYPLARFARPGSTGVGHRVTQGKVAAHGLTRAFSCRYGVLKERVRGDPLVARRSQSRSAVPGVLLLFSATCWASPVADVLGFRCALGLGACGCLWPKVPQDPWGCQPPRGILWPKEPLVAHAPPTGDSDGVDTKPQYEQVAHGLRERIAAGELAPGSRLDSENQLSAKHGVSRDVARKALQVLVNEGLIESWGRQQGYRVRDVQPLVYHATKSELASRRQQATADIWMTDVTEIGRRPAIALSVYIDTPSQEVAELLGIAPGEPVVIRRRLRLVDDQAYAISVAHFPPWAVEKVPSLANAADLQPGPAALLTAAGHDPVRILDRIHLRMPTPDERDVLRLPPGVPVAEHVRAPYDDDGRAIRVTVTTLPGDRWTLEYEVNPRDT